MREQGNIVCELQIGINKFSRVTQWRTMHKIFQESNFKNLNTCTSFTTRSSATFGYQGQDGDFKVHNHQYVQKCLIKTSNETAKTLSKIPIFETWSKIHIEKI